MNIKPSIYEKLTPRQRSIALSEARARGDEKEADRLNASCPDKYYTGMESFFPGLPEVSRDILREVLQDINGQTAGLPVNDLIAARLGA